MVIIKRQFDEAIERFPMQYHVNLFEEVVRLLNAYLVYCARFDWFSAVIY